MRHFQGSNSLVTLFFRWNCTWSDWTTNLENHQDTRLYSAVTYFRLLCVQCAFSFATHNGLDIAMCESFVSSASMKQGHIIVAFKIYGPSSDHRRYFFKFQENANPNKTICLSFCFGPGDIFRPKYYWQHDLLELYGYLAYSWKGPVTVNGNCWSRLIFIYFFRS